MSGFAGFFDAAPLPGARAVLAGMRGVVAPDAAPEVLSAAGDFGLVGAEPGHAAPGECVIAFDGEIYNLPELRRDLAPLAGGAPSMADVVLQLYLRHGPGAMRRLRGQFACAIFDPAQRRLVLARDPLGVKRLYVTVRAGPTGLRVGFATALRALVAGGLAPARLDAAGVAGFLRYGAVPEPHSMIAGVSVLPAGTVLSCADGAIRREPYWTLPGISDEGGSREPVARETAAGILRDELLDAVAAQLAAPGPTGVVLGPGTESAAVAGLAQAAGAPSLHGLSIACGEPSPDEVARARAVAAAGGRYTEWRLAGAEAADLLERHFAGLDQPAIAGFEAWCVARLVREAGCRAALVATGGDALFGASPVFGQVGLLSRVARLPSWTRRPLALVLGQARAEPWRQFGEVLAAGSAVEQAWEAARGVFARRDIAPVAAAALGADPGEFAAPRGMGEILPRFESPMELVSYLETTRHLREGRLAAAARAAAAWGTELRLPLVDANVVRAAWMIPAGLRLEPGAGLLALAVPELGAWPRRAPERMAASPLHRWAEAGWRELFRERGPATPLPPRNRSQAWALLALDRWIGQLRAIAAAAPAVGRDGAAT